MTARPVVLPRERTETDKFLSQRLRHGMNIESNLKGRKAILNSVKSPPISKNFKQVRVDSPTE